MPQIREKPVVEALPGLFDLVPLSNEADHVGRPVIVTRNTPSGLSERGRIVGAYTAERKEKNARDAGRRDTYYLVETPTARLVGLTWWDFISNHAIVQR